MSCGEHILDRAGRGRQRKIRSRMWSGRKWLAFTLNARRFECSRLFATVRMNGGYSEYRHQYHWGDLSNKSSLLPWWGITATTSLGHLPIGYRMKSIAFPEAHASRRPSAKTTVKIVYPIRDFFQFVEHVAP